MVKENQQDAQKDSRRDGEKESELQTNVESYIKALWPTIRAHSIEQFVKSDLAQELVDDADAASLDSIKERMKVQMDSVLDKMLEGQTMAQIQGMDQQHLDAIYAIAEARLGSGEVEDAASLFQLLIILDPTVARFFTAFGACQQTLKHYDYALQMYAVAQALDMTDPRIPQNAAMCCIYLGQLEQARGMANRSLSMCEAALLAVKNGEQSSEEPAELQRLAQKCEQLLQLIAIRERNASTNVAPGKASAAVGKANAESIS